MKKTTGALSLFLLIFTILGCDNVSSFWTKPKAEEKKSRLELVMEEARANLKLPQFAEIPSMRGAHEEEKNFQNSPYYFTLDMIEAFKYVWGADELHEALNKKSDTEVNEQMYKAFLEKIRLLRSAVKVLRPYSKSENEMIKSAAEATQSLISQQLAYNFDTLAFLKHLNTYVPEKEEDINEAYRVIEEMKYEIERIRAEYDGTYRGLTSVASMMTHILVDGKPDESGHLSRLAITMEQKNEIIASMNQKFKPIPPFVAGEKLSKGPVAIFYQWITTSEHTPKDL